MFVAPPPRLLYGVLKFQALQALPVFSHFFRTTPFISNPGAPPWWPRWECSWPHFLPGGTFDLSDTSRRFAGLPLVLFSIAFR
jgi:hypothetical protein